MKEIYYGTKRNASFFCGAAAIVTSGASRIGRALAEELAKRGCKVKLPDRPIGFEDVYCFFKLFELSLFGGRKTSENGVGEGEK